jgi:hypothetical protein
MGENKFFLLERIHEDQGDGEQCENGEKYKQEMFPQAPGFLPEIIARKVQTAFPCSRVAPVLFPCFLHSFPHNW